MVAPVWSTTRTELNFGEIVSLNQSRATPGAWASTRPSDGSDRTRSACALAGRASNSVAAAAPRTSAALRRRIRTADGLPPVRVVPISHRMQMSLDDDALHLGVAEQHGYLATAVHPVTGVLENEVVADGRLQLPVVGMAHQQAAEDEAGARIDDRRRRPSLVDGHGLAGVYDLISQVEKSPSPGHRDPDEPHAATLSQAGRRHRRPMPISRRLIDAGPDAGLAAGALRQPKRQRPDSGCDEHTDQEPGDPNSSGHPEPAPTGGGGAGPRLDPCARRAAAHHG